MIQRDAQEIRAPFILIVLMFFNRVIATCFLWFLRMDFVFSSLPCSSFETFHKGNAYNDLEKIKLANQKNHEIVTLTKKDLASSFFLYDLPSSNLVTLKNAKKFPS